MCLFISTCIYSDLSSITNKSTLVIGKTEKYARVKVRIGKRSYFAKANFYGNYKVKIPVQNTRTDISITAIDSKGNVSSGKTIKVVRVAPNMPTVYKITNKSTLVIGKTEKYARVKVRIGKRSYFAKANVSGSYKVKIPKKKVGTKIYVNATDARDAVSTTKIVYVKI